MRYIIKTQNGRDKPRFGVAIFSKKKGQSDNEVLALSGNKTFATRKNAQKYSKKTYGEDSDYFEEW